MTRIVLLIDRSILETVAFTCPANSDFYHKIKMLIVIIKWECDLIMRCN